MALEDIITKGKDKMPDVTPTPPAWHPQASVHELKARLNWGEPGLTIVDVREHDVFNHERILGAVNFPMSWITQDAHVGLPVQRDIYIYGTDETETVQAANLLRQAGYQKVAELKGGLPAWQEISGPTEGADTSDDQPGPGAYNIVSRLKEFAQVKAKEQRLS